MAWVVAGMTTSLDGFIEDAAGSAGALYSDFDKLTESGYLQAAQDETGAALMGRRTFDMAEDPDLYADNYELQVPIFVVTHTPPSATPKRNERLSFTFVTDLHSAVAQAAAAAGDRAVTVIGGADINQQLLAAGLVDELRVDVMPVLLGSGVRLFDGTAAFTLEKLDVKERGVRTTLRFRVVKPA